MPDDTTGTTADDTPISTPDHAYDDPSLSPLQFLLAVMHDPTADMADRIKAAETAVPYVPHYTGPKWEDLAPEDRVTIVVRAADLTVTEPVRQYTGSRPNDLVHRILDPHPFQRRWTN
jgi:hypothetical protein